MVHHTRIKCKGAPRTCGWANISKARALNPEVTKLGSPRELKSSIVVAAAAAAAAAVDAAADVPPPVAAVAAVGGTGEAEAHLNFRMMFVIPSRQPSFDFHEASDDLQICTSRAKSTSTCPTYLCV